MVTTDIEYSSMSAVVASTLRDIDRVRGCGVVRKTCISPHDLLSIRDKLHFSKGKDAILGAASLVLFFSLLHKSLALPNSSCATVSFWEIDPLQR